MSSFESESLELLNNHAEKLRASFYKTYLVLNDGDIKPLQGKEITSLLKGLKDGKSPDQVSFPHLSADNIEKFGQILRSPYLGLVHFIDFQRKSIKLFSDVANESRNFDLNWNYVLVINVIKLFTNYIRLHLFLNSIPDIDKVSIVYGYCYKMKTSEYPDSCTMVTTFIKERDTYRILESELQILKDHFYGLFKSVVPVLDRVLNAGMTFTWNVLNLADNPKEYAEDSAFFKMEYIIMMRLMDICECFICYCMINHSILNNNQQFIDVFSLVISHIPQMHLYGEIRTDVRKVFDDFRKIRNKKSDELPLFDKQKELIQRMKQIRAFRCRKLIMISKEYVLSSMYDPTVLQTKLVVVLSLLGFCNFEILSRLCEPVSDQTFAVISLLSTVTKLVTICMQNISNILRFLVYNFHEYDGPFLNSKIHSFSIPQNDYNRLSRIVEGFKFVNINDYDNGKQYDLNGMRITLMRVMAWFNKYSINHGILHLSSLFELISAIYFRVDLYSHQNNMFLSFIPLNQYWMFKDVFSQISMQSDHPRSLESIGLLQLIHFYSYDINSIEDWPSFPTRIKEHANTLFKNIMKNVSSWLKSLMFDDMKDIREQVSISSLINPVFTEKNQNDKYTKISDIPIGNESFIQNRYCFYGMSQKIFSIASTIRQAKAIGTISTINEPFNVFDETLSSLGSTIVQMFESVNESSPFELLNQIKSCTVLMQNITPQARIDHIDHMQKCLQRLQHSPVSISNSLIQLNGSLGHFSHSFYDMYTQFFRHSLVFAFYSITAQAFFAKPDLPLTATPPHVFASRPGLRTLQEVLGNYGMLVIDIAAVDTITEHFKALSFFIDNYLKDCDPNSPPAFASDPLIVIDSNEIIKSLCTIGAIVKFRSLLRNSISIDFSVEPEFSSLKPTILPHQDVLLFSKLKSLSIIKNSQHPHFPALIGSLFSSLYWSTAEYNTLNDAFMDNSHLMCGTIDSIIGVLKVEFPAFDYRNMITTIMRHSFQFIRKGDSILNTKKKRIRWPQLTLVILLDHFIKNSKYGDYSLLEPIVPYKVIRSIYTNILRSKDRKDDTF